MPRTTATWSLPLTLLLGCPAGPTEPNPPQVEPPAWCEDGRAGFLLGSSRDAPIGVWPDDHWVSAADTVTGLRVDITSADADGLLSEIPPRWHPLFNDLSTIDGWGLTAGVVFRFEFIVDVASVTEENVGLVILGPDGPEPVGVDIEITEFPDTVILRPRRPLPHATPVAAAVFQGATSSDGTCIRPGRHLRELLSPATELAPGAAAHPLAARYQRAANAFGRAPEDIAAMTVFTTQSTPLESVEVAKDIRGRDFAFVLDGDCAPSEGGTRCDGTIEVNDYRTADRVTPVPFDATPQGSYALPVCVWLPEGPGPHPTAMVGHGLSSRRDQLDGFVPHLMALGIAVISTDALEHGDHPDNTGGAVDLGVIDFFAITTDGETSIDPRRLRDNFRQSTWDRLQVLEAVRDGLDADGDGTVDLDETRLLYVGQSLGGMMGSETMALTDDFLGGYMVVAGGRLISVVTGSESYAPLLEAVIPPGYSGDDLTRVLTVVQAVADGGDPMVWASWIIGDRLLGDPADPPQLLSQYVLGDEVVNNKSNTNHAAGLGLPLVGREIWPQPELDRAEGSVEGNLPNGGTAAIQLFDNGSPQTDPDAPPQTLSHGSVAKSWEAWSVWYPFLEAMAQGEAGRVSDPYGN